MIKPDQDLVVRLESALTLKMAIDDYNYDPNQLVEFQHEACTNLFNLLVNCEGMGSLDDSENLVTLKYCGVLVNGPWIPD